MWPAFEHARSFEAVGADVTGELSLLGSTGERVRAAAATPEFFDVMKTAPSYGRAFRFEDLAAGSFHLAVISHELWQTRFHGDREILKREIVLDRETFVVLGVMPRAFALPGAAEVWVPARWASFIAPSGTPFPMVVGRLARGVSPREAVQEILQTPGPIGSGKYTEASGVTITPLRDTLVGELRVIILLLAAGAFVVLLVASANIRLLARIAAVKEVNGEAAEEEKETG